MRPAIPEALNSMNHINAFLTSFFFVLPLCQIVSQKSDTPDKRAANCQGKISFPSERQGNPFRKSFVRFFERLLECSFIRRRKTQLPEGVGFSYRNHTKSCSTLCAAVMRLLFPKHFLNHTKHFLGGGIVLH